MKTTKEDLLVIHVLDGKETGREIKKNRTIYRRADGTEEINYLTGKRKISRDANGQAVFRDEAKTVQAMSGTQFVEMLKQWSQETKRPVAIVTLSESGVSK